MFLSPRFCFDHYYLSWKGEGEEGIFDASKEDAYLANISGSIFRFLLIEFLEYYFVKLPNTARYFWYKINLSIQVFGYARKFAKLGIAEVLVDSLQEGISSSSLVSASIALKAVAVNVSLSTCNHSMLKFSYFIPWKGPKCLFN